MRIHLRSIPVIFTFILLFSSCGFIGESDSASNAIQINTTGTIQTFSDNYIELSTDTRAEESDFPYTIQYVAEIGAVSSDGHTMQANHVVLGEESAYIAYNTYGDTFSGAVQKLNVADEETPSIEWEILFKGFDVNALALNEEETVLYFGGSADYDTYLYRSFIGKIDLTDVNSTSQDDIVPLNHSYTVTGIAVSDSAVYATTGSDEGGLVTLSLSLTETDFSSADDVRALALNNSGQPVMLQGSSRTALLSSDSSVAADLDDSMLSETKASLEINGSYHFIGASDNGIIIWDETSGNTITEANPAPFNEMADSDVVTNSVGYDNELIFAANGGYGFRVFSLENGFSSGTLTGKGYYKSDASGDSVNHIAYKRGYLFSASGNGGVSLYKLGMTRGQWTFDSGSAKDGQGNNDGTISGAVSENNGNTDYLTFDGSDDYVVVEDSGTLEMPGSFTIQAWFKADYPGGSMADYGTLVAKDNSHNNRNYWLTMWDNQGHGGSAEREGELRFRGSKANYKEDLVSDDVLTDGQWHFAVVVYDDSTSVASLYVDGVLNDSKEVSNPKTQTSNVYFGAEKDGNKGTRRHFMGSIDDITIKNETTTAAAISDYYNTTSSRY